MLVSFPPPPDYFLLCVSSTVLSTFKCLLIVLWWLPWDNYSDYMVGKLLLSLRGLFDEQINLHPTFGWSLIRTFYCSIRSDCYLSVGIGFWTCGSSFWLVFVRELENIVNINTSLKFFLHRCKFLKVLLNHSNRSWLFLNLLYQLNISAWIGYLFEESFNFFYFAL